MVEESKMPQERAANSQNRSVAIYGQVTGRADAEEQSALSEG